MAAPNLKTPTTITGKTALYSCTTSLAAALSNASSSGKLLKVNVIRAANVAASSSVTLDVTIYRGSTHTYLAKAFSISASSSLITLDRNEFIYLEEGDAIYAKASASSSVDLTITYEEIS